MALLAIDDESCEDIRVRLFVLIWSSSASEYRDVE